jgi:hypothetical protein
MTTLADLQRAEMAHTNHNGTLVLTRPTTRWPFITSPSTRTGTVTETTETETRRRDGTGALLLISAGLLLAGLAIAMGIVSWHAQFAFIFAIKHQRLAAALEALGLDAATVVFSILGIAMARLGRRAVIERALVCICAAGSCAMNAAGADLGSPRSVAAFLMPPLLFAIVSDRLIAVIHRSALGRDDDNEVQRSAWTLGGRAALYVLRLAVAPPSTARGARQALLNATPLPEPVNAAAERKAIDPPKPRTTTRSRKRRGSRSGPSKTQRFLALVAERHGPLADFPVMDVSRIAAEIAPEVDLNVGSARRELKAAVLAAQAGTASGGAG